MARHLFLVPALLALSALLPACGDGESPAGPTTTSTGGTGASTSIGGSGGDTGGSGGDTGGSGGDTGGSGGDTGGSGGGATCGDGVLTAGEGCDDGNTAANDGCDGGCAAEHGFDCSGRPSDCVAPCGDGLVASVEACDDGNTAAGDGCDAACLAEAGFDCAGEPSACVTECGDGIIAGTEGCDDGGAAGGDGCSAQCTIEVGYVCVAEPSLCGTVCGDAILAGAEGCDDGDMAPGDGCNTMCAVENGYACAGEPSACSAVCGDGMIVAAETCDDSDLQNGDGCSDTCAVENGFVCLGAPSTCATVCGDGIIAGAETCDDSGSAAGDGCGAGCAPEPGYLCAGAPSACVTVCGDGIEAGMELCDDGNQIDADGCSSACIPGTGESCADPMGMGQATLVGATYTWTVPAGAVSTPDGEVACDPNAHGPDVVVAYVKTSNTLANGGQLLHVEADTPLSAATASYLNVEVFAGGCPIGVGTSVKCLWFKDNWDLYLDVPPGTYHIWAQKNSAGTFPDVTIAAEEVAPATAEGEGCFAPYTSASAIYTPPGGAGQPHTWLVPASINSFDMGATWGEPGSVSCDNTAGYGDIHGVDAVIQFDKVSPTSVLKVDVQNLDPAIGQSDLDIEVLSVCDPSSPAKVSRNCRANKDTFSLTAPSPAGPVYLWVSSEATSEEFNGASVQVTEIFPGVGESWPSAEPITGPGPISPTSTQRLDPPTCFTLAGNVHWYRYTLTSDALSFAANTTGHVGVYDENGQEVYCVTDAATSPLGILGSPGETFYIAVYSPGTVTSFSTLIDTPYSGVQGDETDMLITFPSSPTADQGMTVGPTDIYLSDLSKVFSFPKVVGAAAVEHGAADGITTTHIGYDLLFAGGSLFSVDSTATVSANRLFRVQDGAAWGPTTWDLTPAYPVGSPSHALATDGTAMFMATRRTATDANFYTFSTSAPGAPVLLGTSPNVWYITGLAADAQYFYTASNGSAGEGVYRIQRASITTPAVKIATLDTSVVCNNIEVDALASPANLYVRASTGDLHAVIGPASASPIHIGAISTLGTASDFAMTFDKSDGSLYLFETETDSAGRVVQLQ
jgi:cysteine-rich repeat protein